MFSCLKRLLLLVSMLGSWARRLLVGPVARRCG